MEFARSSGPFERKFCPFCACDHLWHKEDSKFLAPKPPPRVGIQQASWTKTSTARRRKACADDLPDTPFTER
jgi:hypothetical protein